MVFLSKEIAFCSMRTNQLYSYHFFRIGRRRYVLLQSHSVKRWKKKKKETEKRVLRTLCLSSFLDLMMITEAANNSDRYTASLAGAGWVPTTVKTGSHFILLNRI